jgi:hypothetical protein
MFKYKEILSDWSYKELVPLLEEEEEEEEEAF